MNIGCLFAVSSWFVQRASLTVNIDLSDVTNRYYAVLYCTVRSWYMRKRIDHWCSVIPEKTQPLGPPFSGKLGKPRFPLEWWAPGLGFFWNHWPPMMDSIYLTYPYQPMGTIRNKQSHVGCTLVALPICVIVKLKLCQHVASQRIQDFLEVFFMIFQLKMRYLVVGKKKDSLFVWGWDRKIHPEDHRLASQGLSYLHTHDRFLYSHTIRDCFLRK